MVPTWLKSLFSRRTLVRAKPRRGRPMSRPNLVQLEDRAVPANISIADAMVVEGNTGTTTLMFTVTADAIEAADITFKINTSDGTAKAGSDYVALTNVVGTIAKNTTSTTVMVTVNGDKTVELDETLQVTLSNLSGGNAFTDDTADGKITNDDSATITIANENESESSNITFTATLTNPVDTDITIDLTPSKQAGDTATATTDFSTAVQTITILAGQLSGTATVVTVPDNIVELDETYTATLGNLQAVGRNVTGNGAKAAGTIANEDTTSLTIADSSASEGTAVGFTASLTNPVDVDVTILLAPDTLGGNTATKTTDYSGTMKTVTILAGMLTGSTTVTTVSDAIVEADETFTATLSGATASGREIFILPTDLVAIGTITNDDTTTLTVDDKSITESNGTLTFTITSTKAVDGGFSVQAKTQDGTAKQPGDYDSKTDTLNFAGTAGESKTFSVDINEDVTVEFNETFFVSLFNVVPSKAGITAASFDITDKGTGTINDDDTAQFRITANASASEGDPISFTVTLSNPVEATTSVTLTTAGGTATNGTDYTDATGTVVTFNPLDTSKTVMVTTTEDNVVEANETFNISIGGLNNGGLTGVTIDAAQVTRIGTINNDDAAQFKITSAASAIEGNAIMFTVSLTNPVDVATSVDVTTSDGSAVQPGDYTKLSGSTVMFPTGTTSKTVMVATTSDNDLEGNETFTIALSNPVTGGRNVSIDAANDTGIGTITNDDAATLSIDDVTKNEADGTMTFTVTLNGDVPGGFKVDFKANDGSAKSGDNDFTLAGGTLTFAGTNGESKTITVTINDDNKVEADETYTVELFNVDPNDPLIDGNAVNVADKGNGTISNDDSAQFKITSAASATEGNKVSFTVSLTNPVDVATSVTVTTADGSAVQPGDYTKLNGMVVNFAANDTSEIVMVQSTGDNLVESDETFTITLGGLNNGGRPTVTIDGANDTGIGTITNDDSAVFSIADAKVTEGGMIAFMISLSNPVSTDTVVTVTTAGVNAVDSVDYTGLVAVPVLFTAGTTSQMVMVATTADGVVEADETFKATLSLLNDGGFPGKVTISGTNGTATGTIVNDDSATLSIGNVSKNEATGTMTFTVTLDNDVQGGFNVKVATADGTAKGSDNDYAPIASQILAFAGTAGESKTFDVTINDDNKVEADETFTVSTSNVTPLEAGVPAGKIANGTGTGTIVNDDSALFSIQADSAAIEGGMVTFVVLLSNPVDVATSVTVTTTDGTAKSIAAPASDNDFTKQSGTPVNFGANVTSVNVSVPTLGDNIVELDEMFSIALGGLNNGGRPTVTIDAGNSTRTGTITNDDSAQFKINATSKAVEGNNVNFTVSLTNPVDVATSVLIDTADGTAVQPGDYTPLTAQLVMFPALSTSQSVPVATISDVVVEADETFTATISGESVMGRAVTIDGANATGTGTITNDDSATLVTIANVTQNEDAGTMTFMVQLSADVQDGFQVTVSTKDGTVLPATVADNDYTSTVDTITFNGTAGETKMFVVPITADVKVEADETFTVHLSNLVPANAKVDPSKIDISSVGLGTIVNDDTTKLTVEDVGGLEDGGPITFTVTLSNPVQGGLNVDFATMDLTALLADNDYTKSTGTLIFAGNAGETQQFTVNPTVDSTIEPDETFQVSLSNVVALGAGVKASNVDTSDTAVGTILTDDKAVFDLAASTDTEGNNLVYTITLSNKVAENISVDFATLAGVGVRPAVSGTDFTAVAQTVMIPANTTKVTVTVPLTDDRRVEGSEQFESQIANIQASAGIIANLSIGTAKATATVTDNDFAEFNFAQATSSNLEDNVALTVQNQLSINATGTGPRGLDRDITLAIGVGGSAKNDTAANGGDYSNLAGLAPLYKADPMLADIPTQTRNVTFDLLEDLNKEGNETIVFTIANPIAGDLTAGNTKVVAPAAHTFTITSDDETIRTYDATVAGAYRFVNDGSGNVQLFQGANLLSTDAVGTQAILLNGTTAVDSATVDYANGSMVPSGGITFNGNGPTAGEQLIVSGGTFTSILNTFTGAEAGTLKLAGTTTDNLAYIATDGVAIVASKVGDLTIQLPAGASDAILEDDGTGGNGISQIRSGNGSFATTTFVNPTGTLTLLTGNAADTLTIADVPDLKSSLFAGTTGARFNSITQNGDLNSNGQVRYFAKTLAFNDNADLTAAGEVELNSTGTATLGTTAIGGSKVTQQGGGNIVVTAGDTATFGGNGSGTLSFAGTIDGPGSLATTAASNSVFQSPIGQTTALANATFGAPVDASATGSPTVTGGNVGGSLNVTAGNIALNAPVTATNGPLVLTLAGGNATQAAPFTTSKLYLNGSGTLTLNNAGNKLTGDGKTIASFVTKNGSNTKTNEIGIQTLGGDLFVNLAGGSVDVRDATDLIIRFEDATQKPAIQIGGNGNAILTSGADVSIEDPRAIDPNVAANTLNPLMNVGSGKIQVFVGVDRNAPDANETTITRYLAEAKAGTVTIGKEFPTGDEKNFADRTMVGDLDNVAKDTFTIRPMLGSKLELNGNSPIVTDPIAFRPYDTLSPRFAGTGNINLVPSGNGNGTFNFGNGFLPIKYTSIENIGGIQANALVVQTGPSISTQANNYAIRLNATISGQPFGSALSGNGIVTNPFVVSPSVGGVSQFNAPQVTFADVDGDTTPDVILANGTGDAPLVTIVKGSRLFGGNNVNLSALNPATDIISQFFAFEETFRGGIQVRAADFNGDGKAEVAVSPGVGGGPRIIVYQIDNTNPNVFMNAKIYQHDLGGGKLSNPYNFFPYESTFRGGVNVAVGDVNGDGVPEIIAGAGFGGGPRVRVYDGKIDPTLADGVTVNPASTIADFFAYDPGFRGGVFVDSGKFDADTIADLVTAPGPGGSAHIQVFQGRKNAQPFEIDSGRGAEFRIPMASFFAFDGAPNLTSPNANRTGVGGVSFGTSTDNLGSSRTILVTRPEGSPFEIVKFEPFLTGTPLTPDDIKNNVTVFPITGLISLKRTGNFQNIIGLQADPLNLLPFNVLLDGGSSAGSA